MKRFCAGLAVLGTLVAPVSAADLLFNDLGETIVSMDRSELPSAAFDWTGFYAGLNAGYLTGDVDSTSVASGVTTEVPLDGAMLGVTLGGNAQFGMFVLGAEGDIAWSGAEGSTACVLLAASDCNAEIDWLGTLTARGGVAFDNILVFAKGGLAVASGRGTVTPAFAGITNEFEDTFVGWTAGAGVEVAVTDAISVKAEYNYIDLGTQDAPAGTIGTGVQAVSPVVHAVKLGFNYHF
nr:porin family protein [uncultured Devosia sp.]